MLNKTRRLTNMRSHYRLFGCSDYNAFKAHLQPNEVLVLKYRDDTHTVVLIIKTEDAFEELVYNTLQGNEIEGFYAFPNYVPDYRERFNIDLYDPGEYFADFNHSNLKELYHG